MGVEQADMSLLVKHLMLMPAPHARQEANSEIELPFVQRGQCRIPVQASQAHRRPHAVGDKFGQHP